MRVWVGQMSTRRYGGEGVHERVGAREIGLGRLVQGERVRVGAGESWGEFGKGRLVRGEGVERVCRKEWVYGR